MDLRGVEAGLGLPGSLRPYQWTGVRFLMERRAALLADEMGLGKTVQVSVALSLLVRMQAIDRALVVVPASLRLNWCRELAAWAPGLTVRKVEGGAADRRAYYRLPIHVLIASYDQIRNDVLETPDDLRPDVVILDEAQYIKNPSSKAALACRMIGRKRSWALTGTPLENAVDDLGSIFRFLCPGARASAMSPQELKAAVQPFFLRRMKVDVLTELPPMIVQDLHLELTEAQQLAYGAVWGQRHGASSEGQMLALITRLKQICNFDDPSGSSCKLDALLDIAYGLVSERKKAIVFSQYVETLRWIETRLAGLVRCSVFSGELRERERDQVLARFRQSEGPQVLLMSLKAGAYGLNLQEADVVILFDRWWNPAVEDQASGRAHRFGRRLPLHVIRFLVVGTVEERIEEILHAKKDLVDEYVNSSKGATVLPFARHELQQVLDLDT